MTGEGYSQRTKSPSGIDTVPKARLYELYWGEHESLSALADRYGVSTTAVTAVFDKRGIQRAPNGQHNYYIISQLSKRTLYRFYWGNGMTIAEIATELNLSWESVRHRFERTTIPVRERDTRATWILQMRQKRRFYEWHWVKQTPISQLAGELGVGGKFLRDEYERRGVPINSHPSHEWTKPIPKQYQWPDSRHNTDADEQLPENPDPQKYLVESTEFDKTRLYELYWEYGLSLAHLAAKIDIPRPTLRDRFEQFGIPTREWRRHTSWEPHHGVPPKYEWPHDHGVNEDEQMAQTADHAVNWNATTSD